MSKWIAITIMLLIAVFDVLLILGSAKLEREAEEWERLRYAERQFDYKDFLDSEGDE